MDFTKATISRRYIWPNLRDDIFTHIEFFKTCHKNKGKPQIWKINC